MTVIPGHARGVLVHPEHLPAADGECAEGRRKPRPPSARGCPLSAWAQTGRCTTWRPWVSPPPGMSPSASALLPMWVLPSELVLIWAQAEVCRESLVSPHPLIPSSWPFQTVALFSSVCQTIWDAGGSGHLCLSFTGKLWGLCAKEDPVCHRCIPCLLFHSVSVSSPH